MRNAHVHPTLSAILNAFDPLAMAERFTAATAEPPSIAQIALNLQSEMEAWNPPDRANLEAYNGIATALSYIGDWGSGKYTPAELCEMLEISLRGTAERMAKAEAGR